jgi:hypothetical protein
MMGDLGDVEITRTCPNAVLPHKRPRRRRLTDEQKANNRRLAEERTLVENYFGRWKSLFGIRGER